MLTIIFFIAGKTLEMTIDPEKYMGRLVDYCMLKINALVTVKETGQSWTGEDNLILEKPKLNIVINTVAYDRRVNVHFCYKRG